MKTKRVLFLINVIPPDYGGGYLRVFRIADRFKGYGLLFKIATFTNKTRYNPNGKNIQINDIVFLGNKILSSFILFPWFIYSHRKDFNVFYVASTQWFTVIPTMVCKMLRKKIVHGVTLSMVDSPMAKGRGYLQKGYYCFKNSQFKMADYIFVNSPLLVAECVNCGYDREKVKLINNPVDTIKFFPVPYDKKQDLRISNGLSPKSFTILFVGSINKRKGCDILPAIFRNLFSKKTFDINFIMCGQKGYPETDTILHDLQNIFTTTGNTLVIKEEVNDTSLYYQMADLFLFPTTNEGMPNVVLEAMASGCMILCNKLPGITDYALSEDFIVENNDVQTYVNRIQEFIESPLRYKEKIQENRGKIEKSFSISSVDKAIKDLLTS